ncbi:hypothetical protein ACSQ67_015481 [Phaseolus vulgaris]
MIGRTISTISVSLLAVETLSDISPLFFIGLLQVLLPSTFIDLYVNGVNQLCDFEIDKGFLTIYMIGSPIEMEEKSTACGTLHLFYYDFYISPFIFLSHEECFLLQTFVFKRAAVFPKPLMISVAFMSLYSLGIALFKDIPDIEGDKAFGVKSFATRLGQKRVFGICVSMFLSAFGVASVAGLSSPFLWVKIVTGVGYAVLGAIVGYRAKFVDLNDKASIRSYYMMIWQVIILLKNLLNVSYVLLPLIR